MVRLRELHVAEDVELTQTTAGEKAGPAGFGAAAAQESDDGGCGEFYSFDVSVAMSLPTGSELAGTAEPLPARLGGGG
jgi:hypothetical protein